MAVGVAVGGGRGETGGVAVGVGVRPIHHTTGGHAARAEAGHAASQGRAPRKDRCSSIVLLESHVFHVKNADESWGALAKRHWGIGNGFQ